MEHLLQGLYGVDAPAFDDILYHSRDIRDYIAKLSEICLKFWCFWAASFWVKRDPNLWRKFINSGHHRTCVRIWWRPTKRPRRFSARKGMKKINQRHHKSRIACLGCPPAWLRRGYNYDQSLWLMWAELMTAQTNTISLPVSYAMLIGGSQVSDCHLVRLFVSSCRRQINFSFKAQLWVALFPLEFGWSPRLGVYYFFVIDSVCLYVCISVCLSRCSFNLLLCLSMESSYFLAVIFPCGTLQNCIFLDFWFRPLTPKIYSPNF